MNQQINLRLPPKLLEKTKQYATDHGYGTVQDLIEETVRQRVFAEKLTPREMKLVERIIKDADENNGWGTEEELRKVLRKR